MAPDILTPKICPTSISPGIAGKIDKINWGEFETAYGNAGKNNTILSQIFFCTDNKIATDATHQLWCSLSHQHVFISTAALPSYDILRIDLLELDDKMKIELLDIFQEFSECITDRYFTSMKITISDWEKELKQKLFK